MMDRHGSKVVGYPGFRRAFNNYKLGLSEDDIRALFNGFDVTKSGEVDYEEFMRILKASSKFN